MKKILLSLCLGVFASAGFTASAVTVDDLMKWGGYCIENTMCDRSKHPQEVYWLSSSVETKFEKVSDTQIRLTGMFDDEYSFIFTLTNGADFGNAGTPSANGTQLVLSGTARNCANHPGFTLYPASYNDYYGNYGRGTNNNVVGSIIETADGGYQISFHSLALCNSNNRPETAEWYDDYQLELFEPNAWVTDDVYNTYTYEYLYNDRRYPAKIDIHDDGTFSMIGMNQLGYAINSNNERLPVTGVFYNDGTLRLDPLQTVLLCEEHYTNPAYGIDVYLWSPYEMCEYDFEGGNLYYNWGLDGAYTASDKATHYGTNTWVTNEGDCSTKSGVEMNFNDYIFASHPDNNIFGKWKFTPLVENTKIDMQQDLTHEVNLQLNKYGVDKYGVYVNATIIPGKNADLVDSYDLFLIDGKHNSIKSTRFAGKLDGQKGHKEAMHITDPNNDYTTKYGLDTEGAPGLNKEPKAGEPYATYNLFVPKAAFPGGKTDEANGYTFFVRTNYKSGSGLAPTFHDMKYFTDVPTAIDNLNSDTDIQIDVLQGAVCVSGAARVEVYTTGGVQVYNGASGNIALTPGLYIVKADTKVAKVAVR